MILEGKGVCEGIAIGKLHVYHKAQKKIRQYKVEDVSAELARFAGARKQAGRQLAEFYETALQELGEANAMIFRVHGMMLEDVDYSDAIARRIKEELTNAEAAVAAEGELLAEKFAAMEDSYMRERAADIRDISERVISILQGTEEVGVTEGEPVILVADDLSPSELVRLDLSKVLAFVTRYGSVNSHAAILMRTMNLPTLMGIDFPEGADGKIAVVDGSLGRLILEPEESVLAEYRRKQETQAKKSKLLQELKGKETVTLDGRKIHLYANIGGPADVANALANDAEGIGLFRSEFVYLEAKEYPTEEKQFAVYRTVAEKMAGRRVVIRTQDIGSDKQVGYACREKEENPAMGYRGIRISLNRTEAFKTQLRAIYRASCYGDVAILFPMITSLEEVRRIHEITAQVKRELKEEGLSYQECELGIMIETPAAVMISDLLAKEVDFFSIGTNDLTQYTLAMDRQNSQLEPMFDSRHEAILRMLKMVVENAHRENCPVGICGELAGDTDMTEFFVNIGVDELSVSPSKILQVRDAVRKV